MKPTKIIIMAGFLVALILSCIGQSNGTPELRFPKNFPESTFGQNPTSVPEQAGKEMLQYQAGERILGFSAEGVLIAAGTHALNLEFIESSRVQPVCNSSDGFGKNGSLVTMEAPPLTRVSYPGLWKGITLKYEGQGGGVVKSTYTVSIGADPSLIKTKSNVPVEVDTNGLLHYRFETGEMIESKPVAWQEIENNKVPVDVSFLLLGEQEIGFKIGSYDLHYDLVIDPVIRWTTYMGTLRGTCGRGIATDLIGNIYVVGETTATWGAPIRTYSGGSDVFIAKLNSSGVMEWNTFLGGTGEDYGRGIALDANRNIFVVGDGDLTWGIPIRPRTGSIDPFIAKINNDGVLQWNTFLGGAGDDYGRGIAIDTTGNLHVAGDSISTWGIPVQSLMGGVDGFIAKLNNDGALQWNTFLGGAGDDYGRDISLDTSGNIFITGTSGATWGTPICPFAGSSDAFISKMNSSGALEWNTFIGESIGHESNSINVNMDGIYIIGRTNPGAMDGDAYIAKFNLNGALVWNTNLSLTSWMGNGYGISTDADGNIYGAVTQIWVDPTAIVVKLNDTGVVEWSVKAGYSGSSGASSIDSGSYAFSIASDMTGCVYVTGRSWYNDPWQSIAIGGAHVAKISDPKITLISPNGGESWPFASSQLISWTTEGDITQVKIEYSVDEGANWTGIVASMENSGSYTWVVPNISSERCMVRVSDAQSTSVTDTSDNVFSIYISSYPYIVLNPESMIFGASGNQSTSFQTLLVGNIGGGVMNWSAVGDQPWLSVLPTSGTGTGIVQVGVNPSGLAAGTYQGKVIITAAGGLNSPQSMDIFLRVFAMGESTEPFGSFDTPIDNSTVMSSIPVTGWALDDIEVMGVKIYRDPIGTEPTQPNGLVFIGDATFVEGARGDVEAIYSDYPLNSRAGWGYMLLTNFLPNSGNGTFTLHAIASDMEGHFVSLGSKTIVCENANAVLPFGAIDTPTQGGTISGNLYYNFGWALTPPYKIIPIDGSTITVWIDGVPMGHPIYNNYRPDIATLFPGYLNSNGAVGVFDLNTTTYENGVHTISWSVTDVDGATDGIGSRYFTIQNVEEGSSQSVLSSSGIRTAEEIPGLPEDTRTAVFIKRGMTADALKEMVVPEADGTIRITIPEITRVAVYLNEKDAVETVEEMIGRGMRISNKKASPDIRYEAYELAFGQLRPLPIGATFDSRDGVFYWQPGPGFLGEYAFVIIDRSTNTRKTIKISILPK